MEVTPGIKRNAVLVILRSGNRYLLLKRFKNPNKGLFTPIGGKLDPHESPRQAAYRETFEETGISTGLRPPANRLCCMPVTIVS